MSETRHHGTWTRDDRVESFYRYLPVDVPPGCDGLRVTLDYDRSVGVLDLGCVGPNGFRGWSGGARTGFAITPTAATPGYLPGELETGTWHVMLGLHRVPPHGLGYEVCAQTGPAPVEPDGEPAPAPEPPPRPPRRELPCPDGMAWLAGDLHAHTVHSDGALGIDELARLAAARGLDFLAVTDHNTVSHHPHLAAAGERAGIALLPGQEITTDSGHANAFGDIGWVDFREPATVWLDRVERAGGLLSVNHPLAGHCAWRKPLARRPPLAEVWHCTWRDRRDAAPLAWWRACGLDVTPIGGSDWHEPGDAMLGSPTTWVACADGDVLGGLRAGRTAISAGYHAPLLLRLGDEFVALEADGALLVGPDGRRLPVRGDHAVLAAEPGAHYLMTHDAEVLAISA